MPKYKVAFVRSSGYASIAYIVANTVDGVVEALRNKIRDVADKNPIISIKEQ